MSVVNFSDASSSARPATNTGLKRRTIDVDDKISHELGLILSKYFNEPIFEQAVGKYVYICDAYPEKGIYQLHYRDKVDFKIYGRIRGIVVDLHAKIVVMDSYGTISMVECAQIVEPEGETYTFHDKDGDTHIFKKANTKFRFASEGTIVRFAFYHDLWLQVTNRSLSMANNNYCGPETFAQMGARLGLPAFTDLYDTKKYSSNVVHTFMLVDHSLFLSSKDMTRGYIVYMGYKVMDTITSTVLTIGDSDMDATIRPIEFSFNRILPLKQQPFRYNSVDLSIDEANTRLAYGLYSKKIKQSSDVRLGTGETIYACHYDDNGNMLEMVRLCSPGYMWRSRVRDMNPNLWFRFHQLAYMGNIKVKEDGLTITDEARREFLSRYPAFKKVPISDMVEFITKQPLTTGFELTDGSELKTRDDLIYIAWVSLIMSVPIHIQPMVATFYDSYMFARNSVICRLISMASLGVQPTTDNQPARMTKIVADIRKALYLEKQHNFTLVDSHFISARIRAFILNEYPNTMYAMNQFIMKQVV